ACSVADRMFSWLRARAASATGVCDALFRLSCICCSQRPISAVIARDSFASEHRSQYAALVERSQLMHSTQITRVRRPWRARSRALSVSSCVSSLGSRTIAMPQSELEPTVPESIMCARKYHSHDRSDQLGVPATARLALPTT